MDVIPLDVRNDDEGFFTDGTNPCKIISQVVKNRMNGRRVLLVTKPSYTLSHPRIRHENRARLRYLLFHLVRQHNWVEASGVLSNLLKGTYKERSPLKNRRKYSVAMELLRRLENNPNAYSKDVNSLYNEIWEIKIHSYKNRPLKDRHVELESIISYISQNDVDSAIQTVRRIRQRHEAEYDPKSNLIMGLTYYEYWYSELKLELNASKVDLGSLSIKSNTNTNTNTNTDKYDPFGLLQEAKGDDVESIYETCSNMRYNSDTSIMIDKKIKSENEEYSGTNLILEHHQGVKSRGFYMNSAETTEEVDKFVVHHNKVDVFSLSNIQGLQWLLPSGLSSLDNCPSIDVYKDAIKYLQLAIQSPPPVCEAALLPLIQLLLLGNQVDEALTILEKYCSESNSVLPLRLTSRLWECFDSNNSEKLSVGYENVLKKDPTCRHSLARLLDLHMKGDYASEQLIEMIALHLEATYPDYPIWRELALCLLRLSQYEEDRASVCVNGSHVEGQIRNFTFNRIPFMFVDGMSGKTWKLRCKWWLNRHYSKKVLASDLGTGDLQLMAYKAACACHLYGSKMEYVVRVHAHIDENDSTLSRILQNHILNSSGFFSNLIKKLI